MKSKKNLGQFFTTNHTHILSGMSHLIANKEVLDPFAGQQDLLNWASSYGAKVSGLDIDNRFVDKSIVKKNNSLAQIPYAPFILTNPPYLGKNKMSKKAKIDHEYEDLYMLAIKKIIQSNSDEGILIVPVNFLSAENSSKIRLEFFSKYKITQCKYFTNQVFDDTTYNVIAFHFQKLLGSDNLDCQSFEIEIIPENQKLLTTICKNTNFSIAGEELNREFMNAPKLSITRLTERIIQDNPGKNEIRVWFNDKKTERKYYVNDYLFELIKNNCILLNVIDSSNRPENWIKVENIHLLEKDALVGKLSSRNIAFILIENVDLDIQKKMIELFNLKLNALRQKYYSLFLTNFRDNNRKRISFEFCYKILSAVYQELK